MSPQPQLPWSTAIRIAWRELRAARTRFLFVILAVAVGVGSLTGVRGFSHSFRRMLLREARTLMAGDLSVRVFSLNTADQDATLAALDREGIRRTWITETVTMASSATTPDPLLTSVKAVDTAAYPFYGAVKLDPPLPLREALHANSVVVSEDLLIRLKVAVGDTLHLGGQDFRIAAVVVSEPDRMTGSLNVGPRVMITRGGLARTGLISAGSRAAERYLFKLPASGVNLNDVRAALKIAFPEGVIADYHETHPIITRGLDRATTFLSLIGLIALVIGAMGVASAMHGHLQQKLDSIAVMKCIGARSAQVIRIYTAQTLMLGLSGGLLGALFGVAVASAFPGLIAKYFSIEPGAAWDAWPAAQGVAISCLVTLLFTLPPLLSIRTIRPAEIFRRSTGPQPPQPKGLPLLIRAAILVGTAAVAATLTEGSFRDALRTGAVFAIGLSIGLALLALAAWIFLRAIRAFLRHAPKNLPGALRHGIANLYRPGNQAQAAVVSLGVGVMFTLTVFLVQQALVRQIRGSAPPGMPNVFLLDIPGPQRQAVSDLVESQPGVTAAPDVAFSVAARINAIDGVPIEQLVQGEVGRRFLRTRSVTEMEAKPPETELLSGSWWAPGDREPQVCATEETAKILKLRAGAVVDWNIWNHNVRNRVACIQRTESIRMSARFEFIFSPGQLAGMPAVYYGSARVSPSQVAGVQRVVYEKFPTVTVINIADVMQIVDDVVQRIAMVIRFISAFTILAGAVMVASSIAGTRFRRMREVVILKTLGATRRRIAWIFTVEFLALGAVAGLMGSLLASGFAALVLKRLLEIEFHVDAAAHGLTVVAAALVAAGAGWAASFRVLGRKPLEILREE
ncbi:MAG TPA: FtsX-like permease family protein [Bryobacteraceae bacterium]|nr:FtsX-like permease family protein [Bryobacteraceae bacterium]